MPSTVLVGAQWGDEGKGKICDLVAGDFDAVVRYSAVITPATPSSSTARSTACTRCPPASCIPTICR